MRNPASLYKERKRDEISIFVRKILVKQLRVLGDMDCQSDGKLQQNLQEFMWRSLLSPSDLKEDNLDTNLTFFIFDWLQY